MDIVFLIVALVLSLAIIPPAIRLAPAVGMVDQPDPRKVHAKPIARVGGIGIVIGALISMVLALPMDPLILSYVVGSVVLFMFGIADDRLELGHYTKFIGQFVAVGLVIGMGGLYVKHFPFIDGDLPPYLGMPLTLFAMVGVINAVNHADGLDGLAGGESLISLSAMAFIAYWSGDSTALLIALATIGGLLGFLRYNSHPAVVFMGDAGSQFLGFTVGFLAVLLTQRSSDVLSPSVAALLIGLPIIDILAVFYLRASGGMNWFRATRNHIHHRLLDMGFVHAESVVLIYTMQALLVFSGVLLRFHSDALILFIYVGFAVALFATLTAIEQSGWQVPRGRQSVEDLSRDVLGQLRVAPCRIMPVMFLIVLTSQAMMVGAQEPWVHWLTLAAGVTALVSATNTHKLARGLGRGMAYLGVVLLAYGEFSVKASPDPWDVGIVLSLALLIIAAMRLDRSDAFRSNPFDYLLGMLLLAGMFFARNLSIDPVLMVLVAKSVLFLYAIEYLINRTDRYARAAHLVFGIVLCMFGLRILA